MNLKMIQYGHGQNVDREATLPSCGQDAGGLLTCGPRVAGFYDTQWRDTISHVAVRVCRYPF